MVVTCEHSSLSHVIHFILLSLSFYSHSIPFIHILSHSDISYHSILSTLILIPFISLSLLFHSIVHSMYTLFIIELVIEEVCTIPYSLIHYSYSSITITSFILSTNFCPHSLPIQSISSHTLMSYHFIHLLLFIITSIIT